jgi:hypothetical protein
MQMRASDDGNVSLTKDQYNSLMALLERNQADEAKHATNMVRGESSQCYSAGVAGKYHDHDLKFKSDMCEWILDTGATDHICNSMNWFASYSNIVPPISVGLPNGNSVQAHIIGKVKICDELTIDRVLYLPDFNVNLMSVSRLAKQHACVISFENDLCIIQEKATMRKIGLAKQLDGLYYWKLRQVSSLVRSNVVSANNSRLWHLRLGHLSAERINCLNKKFNYIPVLDHVPCDECHMAKQKKLPFPISISHAKFVFDLIHIDVWGPFSTFLYMVLSTFSLYLMIIVDIYG